MRACLALLLHSVRRVRSLVLAMAALLAAFQILLAFAARSLQELNTFPQLAALIPDFLRQILGPSLLTLMSFRGIACLGYFHVAIMATLIGLMIALATEPVSEAETRFLDLILSHPLARHWVISRTIALLAACIVLLLGAMMSGTRLGLYWLAPEDMAQATFRVIPALTLNLGLLLLCWGSIALALASIAHRRSVAAAATALLAMACYMTDLIAQIWKPLKPVVRYSPFHYYNSLNLIMGSSDMTGDTLTLASIAVTGFLLAYLFFQRRDL
ncbi:MAG: ABC transporter permease subunit [Acidobacteriia bacterium]|nr:ABC transporter permease subunit [Terriglobia bacterium]